MSSSATPIPVVPTYIASGRFANGTEDNHAGAIWISTLLCLVYSTIIMFVRAHLRWNVFSLDDFMILAATVLQTGEVVAVIIALQHGLGRSYLLLTTEQVTTANTATFVSIIFFIASNSLAKISVIFLMMRLFNLRGPRSSPDTRTRFLWGTCIAVLGFTTFWTVGSMIGLSVNCSVKYLTTNELQTACPKQGLRWDIIGSIDAATEVFLVILAVIIVWPVQLKLSMKLPIIFAFTFRLPCAALSIVHIYYVNNFTHSTTTSSTHTQSPGMGLVPVLVIMQIQLCWSMISATIPNLKSFVRSFNASFGLGFDLENISKWGFSSHQSQSQSRSRSINPEYELSRIQSSGSTLYPRISNVPPRPSRKNVDIEGIGFFGGIPRIPGFGAKPRWEIDSTPVPITVPSPEMGSASSGSEHTPRCAASEGTFTDGASMSSREHIIRKDTSVEVRYEMA